MKLFLIGMPGAGKSFLGSALSEILNIPHVDTDNMIEKRCGRSVQEMFSKDGEPHFRHLEREALLKCVEMEGDMICSTGGGIIENAENRTLLKKTHTIYLKKTIDELLNNLNNDSDKRPLLTGNRQEKLVNLFHKRKEHFELFPSISFNEQDIEFRQLPGILYDISDQTGFGKEKEMKTLKGLHPVIISPFMAKRLISDSAQIITSKTVHSIYSLFFQNNDCLILPDGEEAKSYENLNKTWDFLIQKAITREETITGFGGGTITDITGFACSTFKRGTGFNFVPTTLLSQVDASLGGKNAINVEGVKNVCGTFAFPKSVYIDPLIVFSTEKCEIENGLVEGLKAALLVNKDVDILQSQLRLAEAIDEKPQLTTMSQFIEKAIRDKMAIVNIDPYEKSQRKFLNLGHTYGHVYEATYKIAHGKAVALGLLKMLKGKKDPIINDYCDFFDRITKKQRNTLNKSWDKSMQQRLLNDKKNTKDEIVFIDLEKPGKPFQRIVKKSNLHEKTLS